MPALLILQSRDGVFFSLFVFLLYFWPNCNLGSKTTPPPTPQCCLPPPHVCTGPPEGSGWQGLGAAEQQASESKQLPVCVGEGDGQPASSRRAGGPAQPDVSQTNLRPGFQHLGGAPPPRKATAIQPGPSLPDPCSLGGFPFSLIRFQRPEAVGLDVCLFQNTPRDGGKHFLNKKETWGWGRGSYWSWGRGFPRGW